MAYQMLSRSYMCRTTGATRVYAKPNDITPSRVIVPAGVVFTTKAELTVGSITFLQIDNYEPAAETWIATDSLEMIPIMSEKFEQPEETQADDSILYKEHLYVNGSSVVIYSSSTSTTPIAGTLELGSTVDVDRKIEVDVNGIRQTRYRISGVVTPWGEMDDECLGCWVLANYSVSIGDKSFTFNNDNLRPQARRPAPGVDGAGASGVTSGENVTPPATTTDNVTTTGSATPSDAGYSQNDAETFIDGLYEVFGYDYTGEVTNTNLMNAPLGRLLFVHGMPFQFTHITDRRAGSTLPYGKSVYSITSATKGGNGADFYGRVFAKEIVSNMPIAVVVPGVPKFMSNVKQGLFGSDATDFDMAKKFSSVWDDLSGDEMKSVFEKMVNDSNGDEVYQYFSMEVDTTGYYQYVNALCRTSAKMMGLGNTRFRGSTCAAFDWGTYNTAADQDYSMWMETVGSDGGVSFAFDPLSSITDSLSNSTTQSQFADMLNGISSKAKELAFLTGTLDFGSTLFNENDYSAAVASLSSGFGSAITNPISKVVTFLKNSAQGFNVRFPEIWSDTNSTKSYDIDMKFIAPYATAFCKWRYVLVPFFHWFALAAPHSDKSVANYSRPYLIRAFSKGYFNVEMGMVKELSWKRFGDGDMISEDGVPTEIDVSASFEDLYQSIAVSRLSGDFTMSMSAVSTFFNNTGLMDLLGTLSGVNMNKISLAERVSFYLGGNTQALKDTPGNLFSHASQRVRNIFEPILLGS